MHNPNRFKIKPFALTNNNASNELILQMYHDVFVVNINCLHEQNHVVDIIFQ